MLNHKLIESLTFRLFPSCVIYHCNYALSSTPQQYAETVAVLAHAKT